MTEQQQREALDRFLKSLQGSMDADTLAKAQQFLDPTNTEYQPLIAAIATGQQRGWMAQDDYQRKTQQLAEERRQLEAVKADFLSKQQALQAYKDHLETNFLPAEEFQEVQRRMEMLQGQLQMATQKLQEYGEEFESPADQGKSSTGQRNLNMNTQTQKPESPFKYMTVEQGQQALEQLAQGTLMGQAQMLQMMQEHRALTGQDLNITQLTAEALQNGKLPADYWQEKFEISKLRAQFAEQQRNQEIEEKAKALAAKMVSSAMEAGQGGGGLRGNGNPFFADMTREPSQRQLVGADLPSDRSEYATDRAAVEAFMSISQTGKLPDGTPVQLSPSGF